MPIGVCYNAGRQERNCIQVIHKTKPHEVATRGVSSLLKNKCNNVGGLEQVIIMKKWYKLFCSVALCILISGCNIDTNTSSENQIRTEITEQVESTVSAYADGETDAIISIEEIPPYAGDAYVEVNGNEPFFTEGELATESYEYYSELDPLGRCGVCIARIPMKKQRCTRCQ